VERLLGYAAELEHFGVRARVGLCTSRFSNQRIDATTNEYDLELRLARTWDISPLSIDADLGAGAALLTQRFETRGRASSRDSLSPYLVIGVGAGLTLDAGYSLGVDLSGETHLLRMEPDHGARGVGEVALRASAALPKAF
jgi:hypothetical protein